MELEAWVAESNRIEGIHRPPTFDEIESHRAFLSWDDLLVCDLKRFVAIVAPGHVLRDKVGLNVRVGDHIAPPGGPGIVPALEAILLESDPYKAHVAYELLHPFTDGNGRSGRALWLRLMGGDTRLGFLHRFYYQTLSAAR